MDSITDTLLGLVDTSAKRWLAVLAAAFLATVMVLVHSFLDALAPSENTVTAQQSTSGSAGDAPVKSEPTWSDQPQAQAQDGSATVTRVSPFDNQRPTVPKVDPAAQQEMVHQQAEYLRQLIAAGKLPKGYGNLTKEQVDEMEKKGISIN